MDVNNEAMPQRLETQIAGHKGKNGLFIHKDGDVLKRFLEDDVRSHRELKFYTHLNDKDHEDYVNLSLRTFVAQFKGQWYCPEQDVRFIRIENLTQQFKTASILDVKIGKITYDPEASNDKILYELGKYPPMEQIGFRLVGMRVFQPQSESFKVYGREFGKKVVPEAVVSCLKLFLQGLPPAHKIFGQIILSIFIHRLHDIKNWFYTQKRYAFYASSLFFVYESNVEMLKEKLDDIHSSGDDAICVCSYCNLPQKVCQKFYANNKELGVANVYMIDFAHVFETHDLDNDYLFGLTNFIATLKIIIDQYSSC